MPTPGLTHSLKTAAALAATTLLAAAIGACSSTSSPPAASSSAAPTTANAGAPNVVVPVAASGDGDWKAVTDVLGRTGKLMDKGTVYRVPLVRNDLHVQTDGVAIAPGLSLGGYAAFVRYSDMTMAMGDLVVTEDELPKVTDALRAHGFTQTALHKHLLAQTPPIWWTHFSAMGDATTLAGGLRDVLAATAIPAPSPAPAPPPPAPDVDTAAIDAALGRTGTADGGLYKYNLARADAITDDNHLLPPGTGVTTAITFQPLGGGKAAINGDFVLTDSETQPVIAALRAGHIAIVELHNHMLTEQPRLFFLHYWAVDDATALAKALRPALDANHLAPPAK